jgi:O-antigen ligase
MNFRRIFSPGNITNVILYGMGLFGFYLSLFAAVIIYLPSRSATIPYRGLILIAAIVGIVIAIYKNERFYKGKLWITLLVFWMLYGLSIFLEPAEMLLKKKSDYSLYAFGVCAVPAAAFIIFSNRRNFNWSLFWMTLSAISVGVLSIGLYGGATLTGGRATGGDFIGDFVAIGPLQISYMGSALMTLAIYWLVNEDSALPRLGRYAIALLLGFIGAYLLALGASKGPILAVLFAGVSFMICRTRRAVDVLWLVFGCLLLFGSGIIVLYFADKMGSALSMRLMQMIHIKETYLFGGFGLTRLTIYLDTLKQFMENPILGNGLYVRTVLSYPHNLILEAYMTTGVFGGTAFLVYFVICIGRAIKIIRHQAAYSWVALLFLHYSVYAQLSSSIITNHYFWYTSAMVIAVYEFTGLGGYRQNVPIPRRRY